MTTLLTPYRGLVAAIVGFTMAANGLNLVVPRLIATAIDTFARDGVVPGTTMAAFVAVAAGIFVFTWLQNIAQVYA